MTLVGVDVVDGKPRQWKIENSWGTKVGEKATSSWTMIGSTNTSSRWS